MKPAQQVSANSKITKFLEKQLMINPVKRFSEIEIKDISLDSLIIIIIIIMILLLLFLLLFSYSIIPSEPLQVPTKRVGLLLVSLWNYNPFYKHIY
jgi:hypothetical protein